jgi:hypothetical protein
MTISDTLRRQGLTVTPLSVDEALRAALKAASDGDLSFVVVVGRDTRTGQVRMFNSDLPDLASAIGSLQAAAHIYTSILVGQPIVDRPPPPPKTEIQ